MKQFALAAALVLAPAFGCATTRPAQQPDKAPTVQHEPLVRDDIYEDTPVPKCVLPEQKSPTQDPAFKKAVEILKEKGVEPTGAKAGFVRDTTQNAKGLKATMTLARTDGGPKDTARGEAELRCMPNGGDGSCATEQTCAMSVVLPGKKAGDTTVFKISLQ
jgi:hypothetical protein